MNVDHQTMPVEWVSQKKKLIVKKESNELSLFFFEIVVHHSYLWRGVI
jgi:hypothetical protein